MQKKKIGWIFRPTDEELVDYFLRMKLQCSPHDDDSEYSDLIITTSVYSTEPDKLAQVKPMYGEDVWYFFTQRQRKYPKGKRPSRTAGEGYWKATSCDHKIRDDHGRLLGSKRVLVYMRGRPGCALKTSWMMHEYQLLDFQHPDIRNNVDPMKLDEWVLCKIYKTAHKEVQKIEAEIMLAMNFNEGSGVTTLVNTEEATIVLPPQPPTKKQKKQIEHEERSQLDVMSVSRMKEVVPEADVFRKTSTDLPLTNFETPDLQMLNADHYNFFNVNALLQTLVNTEEATSSLPPPPATKKQTEHEEGSQLDVLPVSSMKEVQPEADIFSKTSTDLPPLNFGTPDPQMLSGDHYDLFNVDAPLQALINTKEATSSLPPPPPTMEQTVPEEGSQIDVLPAVYREKEVEPEADFFWRTNTDLPPINFGTPDPQMLSGDHYDLFNVDAPLQALINTKEATSSLPPPPPTKEQTVPEEGSQIDVLPAVYRENEVEPEADFFWRTNTDLPPINFGTPDPQMLSGDHYDLFNLDAPLQALINTKEATSSLPPPPPTKEQTVPEEGSQIDVLPAVYREKEVEPEADFFWRTNTDLPPINFGTPDPQMLSGDHYDLFNVDAPLQALINTKEATSSLPPPPPTKEQTVPEEGSQIDVLPAVYREKEVDPEADFFWKTSTDLPPTNFETLDPQMLSGAHYDLFNVDATLQDTNPFSGHWYNTLY